MNTNRFLPIKEDKTLPWGKNRIQVNPIPIGLLYSCDYYTIKFFILYLKFRVVKR